jgi:hypothetical protein
VSFGDWTAHLRGTRAVRCSTRLVDNNPGNDWGIGAVTVRVLDAGVTAILSPCGELRYGDTVTPLAQVRNFGTTRGPVTVTLGITPSSYRQTITLPAGLPSTDTVLRYPAWRPDTGHYACRCSVALAGDVNPANDALGSTFVVSVSAPRWVSRTNLPMGPKAKRVKEGCALAYNDDPDGGAIYAFKGNNTCEFYRYQVGTGGWTTRESIPPYGSSNRKKTVRKGASLTQVGGLLYGAKGNNSCEFWRYDPLAENGNHWHQCVNVPAGSKAIREGSGCAGVTLGGLPYVYFLKGSGTYEFYRYNIAGNTWETMASAPGAADRKPFKNGSCLSYDQDSDTIFVLKANYNEFFAYSVRGNTWTSKETLPKVSPPRSAKKKVKDGAGIACNDGTVYALKGGNTFEFWKYPIAAQHWYVAEDILAGPTLKRVRSGGALVYAPCKGNLYATKGNNTLEFYMYWLTDSIHADRQKPGGTMLAAALPSSLAFSILPNPARSFALIRYDLPAPGHVSIKLYRVTGALQKTLWDGCQLPGRHVMTMDCQTFPAGAYLIRYETEFARATEKVIID